MIGVYDSGFGGLTVLRALRAALPDTPFTFLGDSGRAPYGGRDTDTILDFAEQCVDRLFEEGCSVVVVACHTVSCVALRHLQQRLARQGSAERRRVLGVTIPAAELAVRETRHAVGWIGTARTIASGTFEAEIRKLRPDLRVVGRAAPLLASIVEEDLARSDLARLAVRHYLAGLEECDTLLLGCTHFPLLAEAFAAEAGPDTQVLDPSVFVAERLMDWLRRHPEFVSASTGSERGAPAWLRVLCSGDPEAFRSAGARFLGAPLPRVEHVAEERGRLVPRAQAEPPRGQVVRAAEPSVTERGRAR